MRSKRMINFAYYEPLNVCGFVKKCHSWIQLGVEDDVFAEIDYSEEDKLEYIEFVMDDQVSIVDGQLFEVVQDNVMTLYYIVARVHFDVFQLYIAPKNLDYDSFLDGRMMDLVHEDFVDVIDENGIRATMKDFMENSNLFSGTISLIPYLNIRQVGKE